MPPVLYDDDLLCRTFRMLANIVGKMATCLSTHLIAHRSNSAVYLAISPSDGLGPIWKQWRKKWNIENAIWAVWERIFRIQCYLVLNRIIAIHYTTLQATVERVDLRFHVLLGSLGRDRAPLDALLHRVHGGNGILTASGSTIVHIGLKAEGKNRTIRKIIVKSCTKGKAPKHTGKDLHREQAATIDTLLAFSAAHCGRDRPAVWWSPFRSAASVVRSFFVEFVWWNNQDFYALSTTIFHSARRCRFR